MTDTSSQITMASKDIKMPSKMRVKKQLDGKKILRKQSKSSKMVKKGIQDSKSISLTKKCPDSAKMQSKKTGENYKIKSPENKENQTEITLGKSANQDIENEKKRINTSNQAEPLSNRSTNSFAIPISKKAPAASNSLNIKNEETFGTRANKVKNICDNSDSQGSLEHEKLSKRNVHGAEKRPKIANK